MRAGSEPCHGLFVFRITKPMLMPKENSQSRPARRPLSWRLPAARTDTKMNVLFKYACCPSRRRS